jgi:hypothetical protein
MMTFNDLSKNNKKQHQLNIIKMPKYSKAVVGKRAEEMSFGTDDDF